MRMRKLTREDAIVIWRLRNGTSVETRISEADYWALGSEGAGPPPGKPSPDAVFEKAWIANTFKEIPGGQPVANDWFVLDPNHKDQPIVIVAEAEVYRVTKESYRIDGNGLTVTETFPDLSRVENNERRL
jgi:hypothetical protein